MQTQSLIPNSCLEQGETLSTTRLGGGEEERNRHRLTGPAESEVDRSAGAGEQSETL